MFYWEVPAMGARGRSHDVAVIAGARALSWRELDDRVSRLATVIAADLHSQPGRRIGILARNSWQYPELCYGIAKARCIAVPLNWRAGAAERASVAANADIDLVFASEELAGHLDGTGIAIIVIDGPGSEYEHKIAAARPQEGPLPGASQDELAMLVYSSGTTSEPKGAMHSHRTLVHGALRLSYEMRLQTRQRFFGCLPFFFAGAQSTMTAPLLRGCALMIAEFDPLLFLRAVAEDGVSATVMVPTMINRVVEAAGQAQEVPAGMRSWTYGGAPMPESELTRATEAFGPVFTQFYGQVETGLLATVLHPEDHVAPGGLMPRLRSAGRPAIGTRVRLVSPASGEDAVTGSAAEITVRSDSIMLGYWRRPELTAETIRDGWVHTGDLALADDEGFVFVIDRLREMIITGGINVFPREIEEVIRSVRAVTEAAVIGVPSADWGEQVVAFVTTDTGTDREALRAAIQDSCRERLAGYKVPRQIVIDTSPLPVTGSGKLAKGELRMRFLGPEAARGTAR